MKSQLMFPALLSVLAVSFGLPLSQAEEIDVNDRPTITVTGHGETSMAPNVAYITIGVEKQASTAADALTLNNQAMQQLVDELERQDVPNKNVQTSSFDISPVYRHEEGQEPEVTGYRVSNLVRVKVVKLDGLGTLLDAVVRVGANRIHSIQFDVDDAEKATDPAREKAVQDARRRAEVLAKVAGAKVGRPLQIQETIGGGGPPRPMPQMMMMARESVPVAQGEQQLTVDVTVVYELLPAE